MNWLFEQPIVIVMIGIALIVALGAMWSSTGRNEWLYGIGAVIALIIAGLVIERMVVTDDEAIRATVLEIARDVQRNDHKALYSHIHSTARDLKAKAQAEMPRYQFTECRVTKINKVDFDRHAEPHSALVEFNVLATGTFRAEGIEVTDTIPRWVRLHFLREKDGRWTVVDYEHDSPDRMIRSEAAEGFPGR